MFCLTRASSVTMRAARSMGRLGRLFGGFVVLLTGLSVAVAAERSDVEVKRLLEKMVDAVHSLNYDGTFVYLHDNQLESMRVLHTVDAFGEKEQLISLNGAAREVVRDDASITCISPESRLVSIGDRSHSGGFRAVFSVNIDDLMDLYDFHVLGRARVADRATKAVGIIPKDNYRYGYRLFVDQQHGLPLKTDMLDADGRVVSQIMFTNLTVGPTVTVNTGDATEGREDFAWKLSKPKRKVSKEDRIDWIFNKLPNGFKVNIRGRRPTSRGGEVIDHFVLSDGLATVSVYVEKRRSKEGLRGASGMGAVNAYGSEVSGHEVTVVGQVPPETVRAVAGALEYIADGSPQ